MKELQTTGMMDEALAGKKIETLAAEKLTVSKHTYKFRKETASAIGVYFGHITFNNELPSGKLIKYYSSFSF